jgi:L-gulonate 3-dehydrogenase
MSAQYDGWRPRVAIVATGVIGRSWARVFTRAGCLTTAWDPNPQTLAGAVAWHNDEVQRERGNGSHNDGAPSDGTLVPCATLAEALDGADYVQESGPETLDEKRAIYAKLDALAPPAAILASSTSTIDMTEIARGLRGASRCIVAHPVNPPHVVPVVEVLGGLDTSPAIVEATTAILRSAGQSPVVLRSFVPGFVLNRLQAALVREAVYLLERQVADADAIDAVVRDGLGLRWAILGVFGVANTNADGGVREYFERFGESYAALMTDLGSTPTFDAALVERIGQQTDAMEGGATVEAIQQWRDRMVRKVVELKREDPHP